MKYTVTEAGKWVQEFRWPLTHKIWLWASLIACFILFFTLAAINNNDRIDDSPAEIVLFLSWIGTGFSLMFAGISLYNLKSDIQHENRILECIVRKGLKTPDKISRDLNPGSEQNLVDNLKNELKKLEQKGLVIAVNNG